MSTAAYQASDQCCKLLQKGFLMRGDYRGGDGARDKLAVKTPVRASTFKHGVLLEKVGLTNEVDVALFTVNIAIQQRDSWLQVWPRLLSM